MKHWFREQMAMYTAYHRNPMNCATHFVGVPLIVFALLVAMSLIPLGQTGGIPISAATVFFAGPLDPLRRNEPVGGICGCVSPRSHAVVCRILRPGRIAGCMEHRCGLLHRRLDYSVRRTCI